MGDVAYSLLAEMRAEWSLLHLLLQRLYHGAVTLRWLSSHGATILCNATALRCKHRVTCCPRQRVSFIDPCQACSASTSSSHRLTGCLPVCLLHSQDQR